MHALVLALLLVAILSFVSPSVKCLASRPSGLFAVPAAIAVATGTAEGRKAAIIWNIFGLADFAVAITLGLITSPGRFQLIVPDVPNIGASAYPNVLTPAFVVPGSILLHLLSLRQLQRRGLAVAARH